MTPDLAAWLLADDGPIAEDERRCGRGEAEPYTDQWHTMACGERQLYWAEPCNCDVPARVLADLAAKRAIVDTYVAAREEGARRQSDVEFMNFVDGLGVAVYALSRPYVDRPGWRDEWAA